MNALKSTLTLSCLAACLGVSARSADDGSLSTRIKAAFMENPDTRARQIEVDATNGVVTLSGTVDNESVKMRAESTARSVTGVNSVRNRLMVRNSSSPDVIIPSSSTAIIPSAGPATRAGGEVDGRIIGVLKADQRTSNLQIDVKSGNGRGAIVLSGAVSSLAERRAAEEVVQGVSGVDKVDDRIVVKRSTRGND